MENKNLKTNKKEKALESKSYFSKEQLLKSERFDNIKDILSTLVDNDEMVTLDDVDGRVKSFLNKEVQ